MRAQFFNTPAPQTIAITDGAAKQADNTLGCTDILLSVTADAFFLVDSNPTVTSSNGHFIPAGSSWRMLVNPAHKISVIPVTGSTLTAYISVIG